MNFVQCKRIRRGIWRPTSSRRVKATVPPRRPRPRPASQPPRKPVSIVRRGGF